MRQPLPKQVTYSNTLRATRMLGSSCRLYIDFSNLLDLVVHGAKKLFMMTIKEVKTLSSFSA